MAKPISQEGASALATALDSSRTAVDGNKPKTEKFLNDLRSKVSDSHEFRALAARLYGGVRDAMRLENLPSFGTLQRGRAGLLDGLQIEVVRVEEAGGQSALQQPPRDEPLEARGTNSGEDH